jgi:hypothetical protein
MIRVWLKANVSHQSTGLWKNSVTMKTDSIVIHTAALFYGVHIRSTNVSLKHRLEWHRQGATELPGQNPYPNATSSTINPK